MTICILCVKKQRHKLLDDLLREAKLVSTEGQDENPSSQAVHDQLWVLSCTHC